MEVLFNGHPSLRLLEFRATRFPATRKFSICRDPLQTLGAQHERSEPIIYWNVAPFTAFVLRCGLRDQFQILTRPTLQMDAASSLPQETLAIIFRHLSVEETFHRRYLEDILLVCRQWHVAALNDSRIWARIIINIEADVIGVYDSRIRHISRRLSLSRMAPLAIEISVDEFAKAHATESTCKCGGLAFRDGIYDRGCNNTAKYIDQFRRLIRLAVGQAGEHMARWISLSIDTSIRWFDFENEHELGNMALFEDLKYPTPLLRVLSLDSVEGCFWTLLPSLPSLTHYKVETSCRIFDLKVPWSSLRSLKFSAYFSVLDRGVPVCLPKCTRLEELCIKAFEPLFHMEELKQANPFKCTLPSLLSFELLCPISLEMTSFNLPSLIHLTLAIPDSFMNQSKHSSRAATLQGVGCISTLAANTRRLELLHTAVRTRDHIGSQASKTKLVEMFEYMPKLEEIYLSSTLYICISSILREDLDIVPHLERIFIVPENDHPVLVSGKDLMPRSGSISWRASIPRGIFQWSIGNWPC